MSAILDRLKDADRARATARTLSQEHGGPQTYLRVGKPGLIGVWLPGVGGCALECDELTAEQALLAHADPSIDINQPWRGKR